MKLSIEKIQDFIKEDINPGLADHGGFLNIQQFEESTGTLFIIMGGGCQGCASAKETVMYAVDQMLKEEFNEIKSIIDVTDHTNGENPYYV